MGVKLAVVHLHRGKPGGPGDARRLSKHSEKPHCGNVTILLGEALPPGLPRWGGDLKSRARFPIGMPPSCLPGWSKD